ncbi:MAG: hypothetical protein AMJ46_14075 [Latescibacteria bacterium DG_63]|nr:MAG: hypothetical protein AMJ46_14075 [Latescibacteria bacterium DG_63]
MSISLYCLRAEERCLPRFDLDRLPEGARVFAGDSWCLPSVGVLSLLPRHQAATRVYDWLDNEETDYVEERQR